MNLKSLRSVMREHVLGLSLHGHSELSGLCQRLALPPPPPSDAATKRQRLEQSFDAIEDEHVALVARRWLDECSPAARERNEVEEFLWSDLGPKVSKKHRRSMLLAVGPGATQNTHPIRGAMWTCLH